MLDTEGPTMAIVRIKHDQYAGKTMCQWDCAFAHSHENSETEEHWRTCSIGCMVEGCCPGPDCPGPGLYDLVPHGSKTYDPATQRVVEEANICKLWDDIKEFHDHADSEDQAVGIEIVGGLIVAANLGRKE